MRLIRSVALIFLIAGALPAQDAPKVEFDVASIRPSNASPQPGTGQLSAGVKIDGAQVHATALTLKDYLGIAYRVKLYQVDGPDWLGRERFDINATLPAGAPTSQIPEMIRSLLEERFRVKVRHEKKEFPVYALEVGKGGIRVQPSPPDPDDGKTAAQAPLDISGSGSRNGIAVNLGRGASYTFADNRFEGKKLTAQAAANVLERFVDKPIVDMTNLTGAYDISIDLTEEDYRAMLIRAGVNAGVELPPQVLRLAENADYGSLFSGLEKLGLKLEDTKAPLDLLVVDSMLTAPTDN
jgi:uncharacterized protein (TIGR03435 family)